MRMKFWKVIVCVWRLVGHVLLPCLTIHEEYYFHLYKLQSYDSEESRQPRLTCELAQNLTTTEEAKTQKHRPKRRWHQGRRKRVTARSNSEEEEII